MLVRHTGGAPLHVRSAPHVTLRLPELSVCPGRHSQVAVEPKRRMPLGVALYVGYSVLAPVVSAGHVTAMQAGAAGCDQPPDVQRSDAVVLADSKPFAQPYVSTAP